MTDIGDLLRLGNPSQGATSAAFTNLAGVATDPTAVVLGVLKPNGIYLEYGWPSAGDDGTLTRESVGRFYAEILMDVAGKWQFRLAGTGAVTAASETSFRVDRQKVVAP